MPKIQTLKKTSIAIIGGGAAGFFAALNCAILAKEKNKQVSITIYEQAKNVLQKVRISGGGRCNVTHACWTPKELVKFYPRGSKELLGPFHTFCCGDTVAWFGERGVELKIEGDGRMFPKSDSSQTIIDCLLKTTNDFGIKVLTKHKLTHLSQSDNGKWIIELNKEKKLEFDKVMIASGSSKVMWDKLSTLGLEIVRPVPSLFTFNIKNSLLNQLMGLSLQDVHIKILGTKLNSNGPLLITHWGLSGPAVLKLSAWGARKLNELQYDFQIQINFTGASKHEEVKKQLLAIRNNQKVMNIAQFNIPKRLWKYLVTEADIPPERTWNEFGKKQAGSLATIITQSTYNVKGKSTFKEEFVTAGGIDLKEIDFKKFESKKFPGLFFAGEVLNIDAITGGFNFQAAWTGGYIVGRNMVDY